MKAIALLKNVDYLSHKPGLTYNGNGRVKTVFGGTMTILIMVTVVVGAVFFGKEIFLRENPISRKSNKLFDTAHVPLSDNPIMFYVSNEMAENLLGDEKFEKSFEITSQVIKVSVSEFQNTSNLMIYNLNLKRCTDELIGQYAALYKQTVPNIQNYLCIDKSTAVDMFGNPADIDLVVNNPYGDPESTSIRVIFNKCDEQKNPGCWQYGDEFTFYVGFSVFDDFLDSQDYSSPVKKNPYFHSSRISSGLFVNSKINLELNELETDSGLIFKDILTDKWFSVGKITNEVEQFRKDIRSFYSFIFSSNKIRNMYFRRYTKIQEVLAYLSGFFKIIALVGQSCAQIVSKHALYNSIVELEKPISSVNLTKTGASVNNFVKNTTAPKVTNFVKIFRPQRLGLCKYLIGSLSCSKGNVTMRYKKDAFKVMEITYLKTKFEFIENRLQQLDSLKEDN